MVGPRGCAVLRRYRGVLSETSRPKVYKIEHSCARFIWHYLRMKKEVCTNQVRAVHCPTCGAAARVKSVRLLGGTLATRRIKTAD